MFLFMFVLALIYICELTSIGMSLHSLFGVMYECTFGIVNINCSMIMLNVEGMNRIEWSDVDYKVLRTSRFFRLL